MSYLDGINYGYDQIASNINIPLMYSASEWEGNETNLNNKKTMLTAKDEWIPHKPFKFSKYPPVVDKPLVKTLTDPSVKKSKEGMVNRETLLDKMINPLGMSQVQLMQVLLIVLIIVIAIQIKFYIKLRSIELELRYKNYKLPNM